MVFNDERLKVRVDDYFIPQPNQNRWSNSGKGTIKLFLYTLIDMIFRLKFENYFVLSYCRRYCRLQHDIIITILIILPYCIKISMILLLLLLLLIIIVLLI